MAVFTVHVPRGVAEPLHRADRTVFLRDGFGWDAFWLGPVALLCRRLWLAAIGWLLVAGLIAAGALAGGIDPLGAAALLLLLALLTGFEAASAQRWALRRRGYEAVALVASPSRDGAERAFFRGEGSRPAPAAKPAGGPGAPAEVIGLFPQAGG